MNWQLEERVADVDLGGRRLSVRAIPLGFQRRLKERGVVPPAAPRTVTRDSTGNIVRDPRGEPVLAMNNADAGYQAAVERYHERVAVLMIDEAAGGELAFDTRRPSTDVGWDCYADSLADELRDAGWTADDLVRVCEAICSASRATTEDVAAAGDCFFSENGGGRSSPGSTSHGQPITSCCERASV